MFNKKTVFILGAGASWHYGYPTGEELVRRVEIKAAKIVREYNDVHKYGALARVIPETFPQNYDSGVFQQFLSEVSDIRNRLAQANPLVIDDFLGRNKHIADTGKLLIAMVLLDSEASPQIRPKTEALEGKECEAGDWVRYIVQQITVNCDKPEDLLANHVTFVTFNYDLSLERRLHGALKNYQWFAEGGFSDQFFSDNRIQHVYGQLYGFDPAGAGQAQTNYTNSEFKLANAIDRAYDASRGIRTISPDEKAGAPEIVKAVAEAEYLYFLGYGFDRRNNELLGLGRWQKGSPRQAIKFTNFGNLNKVSRQVELIYNRPRGSLAGPNYFAEFEDPLGRTTGPPVHRWTCEKSIRSVYDALAGDFDWPD